MPRQRVADGIVGDSVAVIGSQAVFPRCIGIVVGDGIDGFAVEQIGFGKNIAAGVVGVFK